jgi:hypothetical protein
MCVLCQPNLSMYEGINPFICGCVRGIHLIACVDMCIINMIQIGYLCAGTLVNHIIYINVEGMH